MVHECLMSLLTQSNPFEMFEQVNQIYCVANVLRLQRLNKLLLRVITTAEEAV